jgi:hypothetical protein
VTRRGAAGVLVVALAAWVLAPTFPNYDSYYHLVWGRELLGGVTPSFEAYAAPTKHPLWVAVAAVLGLIGEDGDRALVLVCWLSWAGLVLGAWRLGELVFGRWPGAVGALFVAASASFVLYAARGYVDVPFLALVAWAAVCVVERRVGWAFGLLVAAGLLRPEAWVLGGLLWIVEGRSVGLLAWVLAAPLLWVLVDLVATGDPLHSLHATSDLADDLGREQGLARVPGAFVEFVGATVRPPVALLGVVGIGLAWRLRRGEARVLFGLFGAGVATFVATGAAGLSILPRYLTVPSVALCVFAGFALAGWTVIPADGEPVGAARRSPGSLRERWRRASLGAVVLGVAVIAVLAPSLGPVRDEVRFIRVSHDALVEVLDSPAVVAARRCGPVTFPNYRLVPDARWHLDVPRAEVGARSARRRDRGVAIFPLTAKGLRRFGFADGASPTTNVPDPGFERIAGNERFAAYAACP